MSFYVLWLFERAPFSRWKGGKGSRGHLTPITIEGATCRESMYIGNVNDIKFRFRGGQCVRTGAPKICPALAWGFTKVALLSVSRLDTSSSVLEAGNLGSNEA